MALPLLALAVALVLVLLAAVLAVLVKLVLWLSVSRSLLAVAAAALYWFVASRRRRYARGFYSCSQVPQTVTTPVETMADEAPSDEAPAAVTGENVPAACVRKPTMESQLADAVPTMTEAPVADVDQDADATVEAAMSDDVVSDSAHGVKVSPVRRRSMQLPGPLALKFKGDASSPSLSATESEDDEDELVLTRSFASLQSATSPTRAAFVPPAPISAARKVRPRSSSSSSGFSVANRKRLLGSPMHHPQNPHPHPHSSTAARPHPNSMTPVRNRRSATIATHHPSSSTSASSANMTPHNVKRNVFARRSAASERELMQEKMAADGYWIGDFRLERQLVPRRSFLSNAANNNGNNGDRSGNNSARSSPRAV